MSSTVKPQATFGLAFEVLATIAKGSTARVDLCRSLGPRQAGQLIAVKRLLPDILHDEAMSKRFLDEVWMTAALRDPHVVTVVGWGQDASGPYLACELVQGVSLGRLVKSVIETGEEFAERLVVYLGLCVAKGLAAAHELRSERGELMNLVHRDMNAANVLVSFQGEVKVADFGLAKAKDRLTVTTSELPVRPMGHIAPEELEQRTIDGRADIFSFGVMLYELLTNQQPFTGKDELAVLESVLKRPPIDVMVRRPKLDKALAQLVMRCLEKEPAKRPQSAREIAHFMEEWLYVHGYLRDAAENLARFVRRNSMRQMRWFESIVSPRATPMEGVEAASVVLREPAPELGAATRSGTVGSAARRDNEPTVVGGRRPGSMSGAPTPPVAPAAAAAPHEPGASSRGRRRESSSKLSAVKLERTSDPFGEAKTHPERVAAPAAPRRFAEIPSVTEEEIDEIPTVALKVDAKVRSELRDIARARRERDTAPVHDVEDPETAQDPPLVAMTRLAEARERESAHTAARARDPHPRGAGGHDVRRGGRDAADISARAIAQHAESELARLRGVALERHEAARVAKEAARRAALAADDAEAEARSVERAINLARAALDLAARGDGVGAAKRLEEALAAASPSSSK